MPVFRDGYELCVPTSTAVTGAGSSATINTKGSVTFTSCATLSLNGVFSSTYDNYMIVLRGTSNTVGTAAYFKLRASGTDNSTNYAQQYIFVDSTSITSARGTGQSYTDPVYFRSTTITSGLVYYLYGPFLSQPTAMRSVNVEPYLSASIYDQANTHAVSSAYDGFSFIASAGLVSGLVAVYGAVQ